MSYNTNNSKMTTFAYSILNKTYFFENTNITWNISFPSPHHKGESA